MPARLRRFAAIPLSLLLLTVVLGAAPRQAEAATSFAYDTFFSSAYERQVDSRTCVAASVAMMENINNGRDLNLNQHEILRYAQARDRLNDATQRGTDPLGWDRAAEHFSQLTIRPTRYRWEAHPTEASALRKAALQIARYGKAVGLLVQHGHHAVVMTGFTSTRNPLKGSFTVTGIWYSDPLGTSHRWVSAASSPLNTYLQTDATPTYDSYWYGKYIIVIPMT
jgi:hypothetical protein